MTCDVDEALNLLELRMIAARGLRRDRLASATAMGFALLDRSEEARALFGPRCYGGYPWQRRQSRLRAMQRTRREDRARRDRLFGRRAHAK